MKEKHGKDVQLLESCSENQKQQIQGLKKSLDDTISRLETKKLELTDADKVYKESEGELEKCKNELDNLQGELALLRNDLVKEGEVNRLQEQRLAM